MATSIRRARHRRIAVTALVSVCVAAFFTVVLLLNITIAHEPLAALPLVAAIVVLAVMPWEESLGFLFATTVGILAVAFGCAALAVTL
ncbi:hypothetical protein N8K70_03745 [Microbacterium betulae]|uniref:Uncharacterized protein n=1 Tax=Microbacterium betulae TaxID=2981139 RepID=A0AA97FIY6_9MICO|nr:hypothetical protein [Microbacterium sp. AB]WOF23803.1 hypothetical protein N8K70_03745 [Microbacterium sp. AB]